MSSASSSGLESSSSSSSYETSDSKAKSKKLNGPGLRKIVPYDRAIKVFAVASSICLIATIALVVLAQFEYVHPLFALAPAGGVFASLIIMKLIDTCRQSVGKKEGIDMKAYDAETFRAKKKEKKEKSR